MENQNQKTEKKPSLVGKIIPLIGSCLFLILDQVSKAFVAATVPIGQAAWGWGKLGNDDYLFVLTHQRNTGVAFSFGNGFPDVVRLILFLAVPIAFLIILGVYYWKDKGLTLIQRWGLALILGGGFGNLIDRAFRPEGVVDFLSFKFFGLFGMDRWPTFNVADSLVVCGGILIVLSFIFGRKKK